MHATLAQPEFHEVANLFPLMDDEALAGLKADIEANGVKEPVWLHDGKIIDGRNRSRACQQLGITPPTRQWDGKGSLVTFVVSLNLHRRHLSSGQKAAIAADIEPMLAKENETIRLVVARAQGDRGKEGGRGNTKASPEILPDRVTPKPKPKPKSKPARDNESREQAAKLTGTNSRYVSDAKMVKDKAPALHEKVRSGSMTLPQAKRAVINDEKTKAMSAKAAAVAAKPKPTTPAECPWSLIVGDCVPELAKLPEKHARLIFADPPYNVGRDYYGQGKAADLAPADVYLKFCREWVGECYKRLTADGSLWVLISDEYADYMGIILREAGLHRRAWIKWYETFGVNAANNFNRCSRHLFYTVKNEDRFIFNADAVNRPSDRQLKYGDKRADPGGKCWDDVWGVPWGPNGEGSIPRLVGTAAERLPGFDNQLPLSLLRPIVACASEPDDMVIDPFNGSGTTGVAALSLGRRYIGIERNEKGAEMSRQRLTVAAAEGTARA